MEAEEEKIVGHAKEAIRALTDKKKNWKGKIGSFLWEILVIVIAVNLTIWFHNWNDKKHERKLEKEFLVDIRGNLVEDTVIIKQVFDFYMNGPLVYYDSVQSQLSRNKISAEYMDANSYQLLNNSVSAYDYSIFQSFSSAGNLRLVENRKLLGDIVSLYSTKLPGNEYLIKTLYEKRLEGYDKYIGPKIGLTGKLSTIIHQPEVKYIIQFGSVMIKESNAQNKELINQIVAVIHEIDKELKNKFNVTL
jgi:RNAse (barnase) inhibitor barstar